MSELIYGMTPERYTEVQSGASDTLSEEEVDKGWRFCDDCDGLLMNLNDDMLCCRVVERDPSPFDENLF